MTDGNQDILDLHRLATYVESEFGIVADEGERVVDAAIRAFKSGSVETDGSLLAELDKRDAKIEELEAQLKEALANASVPVAVESVVPAVAAPASVDNVATGTSDGQPGETGATTPAANPAGGAS